MIYAVTTDKPPHLLLMLTDQDVYDLHRGATLRLDETILRSHTFTGVIVTLHRSEKLAAAYLRSNFGDLPAKEPDPRPPKEDKA